jgi:Na+/proline symporter
MEYVWVSTPFIVLMIVGGIILGLVKKRMTRRGLVFAVLTFVLLLLLPMGQFKEHEFTCWIQLWIAYPLLIDNVAGKHWHQILICVVVIALHVGMSCGMGYGLDRLASKIHKRRIAKLTARPR